MQSKATRYSGDIKISIVYSDEEQEYACRLEADGERTEYTTVGEPKILEHAVDSPEALDTAAHAALSFALDDQRDIMDKAASTDSGWHVGRTEADRWPVEEPVS
jgi:hypothetical protein